MGGQKAEHSEITLEPNRKKKDFLFQPGKNSARRDKKAFLSDQYKEIEENNRMGKTRDLFKKIRDTKGTFMQRWA